MTNIEQAYSLGVRALLLALLVFTLAGLLRFLFFTQQPAPLIQPPEALAPVLLSFRESEVVISEDITARPLFWVARRPIEPATEAQEVAEIFEDEFEEDEQPAEPGFLDEAELLGVFATLGKSGVIIHVNGERKRVALNDDVSGWRLVAMSPTTATFFGEIRGSGSQEVLLELVHAGVEVR